LYSIFRWSNVASAKNQTMKLDNLVLDNHTELHNFHEEMGDNHVASSLETPLRDDAFNLSDDEKITKISHHFRQIMETIGLDLTDDSLNGTPKRVAKMFVKEIFKGLNPENKPAATMFENKTLVFFLLVNITFCRFMVLLILLTCLVAKSLVYPN
jgi:GTP cyclohydrolase I